MFSLDPYNPRQDPLGTIPISQHLNVIYTVKQRHQNAIPSTSRRNAAKRRLEHRRLHRDPDDVINLLLEPIGDPYRCLKFPSSSL